MFVILVLVLASALVGCTQEQTQTYIVQSNSMNPTFSSGDIVKVMPVKIEEIQTEELLINAPIGNSAIVEFEDEFVFDQNAPIVVYTSEPTKQTIISRAVLKIHAKDGYFLITKGDANPTYDQDCGRIILNRVEKVCISLFAIDSNHLIGEVVSS